MPSDLVAQCPTLWTRAGHAHQLEMLSSPAGYCPQSEGQENPTVLRKDEQLLCDLPLEAAVIRGLGAGWCSRLCCGLQCVVSIFLSYLILSFCVCDLLPIGCRVLVSLVSDVCFLVGEVGPGTCVGFLV